MGTYVINHQQHCGTSRSLTDIFVMLRNNAIQNRHVFDVDEPTAVAEDRLTLIPLSSAADHDHDTTLSTTGDHLIPEWVHFVDEVQYVPSLFTLGFILYRSG
ncbi:unnamed protein product [Soboliphyme baturini]|uniref:Uncharacterized protein n=1 Tax=Soboliphyme baturini TaxID=241478 RepID=A0A183IAM0_9BILA|nr:unnamed protein product [Soboliphyme baturini]VDO87370.1 unnamed protein product [Soboliphyme baturini]